MSEKQTEAQRLADAIHCGDDQCKCSRNLAAAELLRMDEVSRELLDAAKLCRPHMYDHASNTPDNAFDKLCAAIIKAESTK